MKVVKVKTVAMVKQLNRLARTQLTALTWIIPSDYSADFDNVRCPPGFVAVRL